jgi:vibriolysin
MKTNRKLVFMITVVFVLCCFMATGSWAAKKVKFLKANKANYIRMLNENNRPDATSIGPVLGLTANEDLKLVRQGRDFNGVTHKRFQQSLHGIPFWGMETIVSQDASGKVVNLHGDMALETKNEIKNIPKKLDPLGALNTMKKNHKEKDQGAVWEFSNEQYGTFVVVDAKDKAHLCYVVSYFADTECGNPSRPVFFIDVKNGKVIDSFDSLAYAYDGTGPGGNQKIGQYTYGTTYSKFGVSINGSTCTMNYADCKTVDLNHGTSGTTPYSYTCYNNTHEAINGAYCPLNDAQYFGQQIYNMYQEWYGVPVLPFQLMMRCHYSTNYENAFWNGSSMTFGDGYSTFYPLVCLDVSAHEVSHGFTENNSGLIYSGQSGGINESFSDMAGEAAKYYMRGTNDFKCGFDIFKSPTGALRYLYDPPLDGMSIDHVDDYYSGLDVHYSCGIFNKAFYLIATAPGFTTHMAFDIFVKANRDYWVPSSTFVQGAEAAQDAAADLGYSCTAVRDAFEDVGIDLVCAGPPVANFSGTPTSGGAPLTVQFTDLSSNDPTSWSWTFTGGTPSSSTQRNPSVTYNTPGNYTVSLTAANASGSDGETKTNYISVTAPQPPVANFTASTTNPSVGGSVTFTDTSTNTPTSWSWTFEGGTPGSSTAQNPTITYNTIGTYDVSLTATNAQGSDGETKLNYITVSDIPYCDSSANSQAYEYIAGVAVANLNNSSGSSGYTDFTYLTANMTQGNSVNVSLTPGFVGSSYTEWWRIWIDYNGDHDFADSGEQVFSGSGSSVVSGNFTVPTSSLIGATRMRVSMSYSTYPPYCGTYAEGEVEDYTANIAGAGPQPPVAAFTGSPTTVTVGGSVSFTDQSTNNPTSWSWVFEGGTPGTSTSQNPTVTYNTVGTFDVTLTAYNSGGSDVELKSNYITVNAAPQPPVAAFTGSPTTVTVGGSVSFTDQSSNSPTSWSWTFEGGTPGTSTSQNPTVTYNSVGTFDVSLTAYNIAGSDNETKVDYITVNPASGDEIAEAVDYAGLTFTHSGSADWYKVTDVYYYGGDSARSGAIGNNASTTIETTISVGSTQAVKFYWKVSSEAGYDYLKFYIDGVEKAKIAGEVNWTQVSYNITAGTHTLKWSYIKDTYVVGGSDCGWVDKLELGTPVSDPIAEAVDYPGLTFTLSGNANWFSQTTTTYYGGDAAQSGDIGNNQTSTMETVISGKTSVKFYWRVSSETNYDYLRFYIDGVQQHRISGSTSWAQRSYTVTSGTHTLKWSFTKDASVSSGSDCGWVDKLELQ